MNFENTFIFLFNNEPKLTFRLLENVNEIASGEFNL